MTTTEQTAACLRETAFLGFQRKFIFRYYRNAPVFPFFRLLNFDPGRGGYFPFASLKVFDIRERNIIRLITGNFAKGR
jgi:hypothetical protein